MGAAFSDGAYPHPKPGRHWGPGSRWVVFEVLSLEVGALAVGQLELRDKYALFARTRLPSLCGHPA